MKFDVDVALHRIKRTFKGDMSTIASELDALRSFVVRCPEMSSFIELEESMKERIFDDSA